MRGKSESTIRSEIDRLGQPSIESLDHEIARVDSRRSWMRLSALILSGLIIAVAAVFIAGNLWLTALRVDGSSMNPLLQNNDTVLVARTDHPAKNDVIAFYHDNEIYIKRAIATGGDVVSISEDGFVSVNGKVLIEPYVARKSLGNCTIIFPYQVPSGTYFVLGDNRPTALDSREESFGTISNEQIVGKIVFRLWPITRMRAAF